MEADAEIAGGGDLGVDQALVPAREQVEMVGGRGAAGEEQLAEADARRHLHRFRVRAAPHLVQLDEPSEERRLLHARHVAGEGLRQVMVRVHEAGQDDLAARVEAPVHGSGRWVSRPHGGDAVVFDEDPSAGQAPPRIVHGGDQTGIVDEDAHAFFFYQVSWAIPRRPPCARAPFRLSPLPPRLAALAPSLCVRADRIRRGSAATSCPPSSPSDWASIPPRPEFTGTAHVELKVARPTSTFSFHADGPVISAH